MRKRNPTLMLAPGVRPPPGRLTVSVHDDPIPPRSVALGGTSSAIAGTFTGPPEVGTLACAGTSVPRRIAQLPFGEFPSVVRSAIRQRSRVTVRADPGVACRHAPVVGCPEQFVSLRLKVTNPPPVEIRFGVASTDALGSSSED